MFIIIIYDELLLVNKSSSCRPAAEKMGLSYLCEPLEKGICIHIVSHLQIGLLFSGLAPYIPLANEVSKVFFSVYIKRLSEARQRSAT